MAVHRVTAVFDDAEQQLVKLQDANGLVSLDEVKQILEKAKSDAKAYENDPTFYRIVVIGALLILLIALVGLIHLLNISNTNTETLSVIVTTLIGGLIGLFAPSPTGK